MITFGDLKSSRIVDIASVCSGSSDFSSYCNEATQRLMTRGNWFGTVSKIQVCVYGGCVSWPRYVGTVLATNLCGHSKPVVGNWYEFLPNTGGTISPRRGQGEFFWDGGRSFSGNAVTESDGWSPVFNPINCTSNYIRVYTRCQKDLGKQITFFGTDSNGQTIMQRDSSGNWSEGITLTLATPFVSTPMQIRHVQRVLKDVTMCPINCFQYDAINDVLLDLAQYDPQETSPSYAHTIIKNFGQQCCNSTSNPGANPRPQQITALVKLAFQPVANDSDLVLIDNIPALKLMLMAIKKEDAGDSRGSSEFEAKAIHEMNLQLRDKIPLDQVPVSVECFGTAIPSRRGIGRLL